jgi:uncharacterized protein (TIGR01777 family)
MRVLIAGASGLVGSALAEALRGAGHTVARLVRPGKPLHPGDVRWDPAAGELDRPAAEGADALVNLAGASIAAARWNPERKKLLRASRVDATRNLVTGILQLHTRPQVFISASAVGYYGNRGDERLTEESRPGDDFLARLARDWEKEAARAGDFGMRTVMLRFGVILATHGGAFERMLLPFRLGLGGRLGPGSQWMSWLTLPEAVGLIRYALDTLDVSGPVNAVAPNAVTNAEFTKVLGKVLRRPVLFPAPAFALRLLLGEMAEALLLSSQRVVPQKLKDCGYRFQHSELEPALGALLA